MKKPEEYKSYKDIQTVADLLLFINFTKAHISYHDITNILLALIMSALRVTLKEIDEEMKKNKYEEAIKEKKYCVAVNIFQGYNKNLKEKSVDEIDENKEISIYDKIKDFKLRVNIPVIFKDENGNNFISEISENIFLDELYIFYA